MLQKNYSTSVIGQSYLSFIYGIELLEKGHSVLLLDDDRLSFGDLYSYGLTAMDLSFFSSWAKDRGLAGYDEAQFFEQKHYVLHWHGTRVSLGASPWENLRELYRKIPDIFDYEMLFRGGDTSAEDINSDYTRLCHRLGVNGFRHKGLESFNFDYVMSQCPASIKELFLSFKKKLTKDTRSASFLYFARALFHKRLARKHSELEIFHFFLCLLSPHYLLLSEELEAVLGKEFSRRGGHLKKTRVREWKFYKSLPWSMELASFEGIIHPQKIVFLGARSEGLPLKVRHSGKKFSGISFSVTCSDQRLIAHEGSWHFWASVNKMGTDFPLWRLKVGEGRIEGLYLYREKKGSKLSFYKDHMQELLFEELEQWLPGLRVNLGSASFETSDEVYLDQSLMQRVSPLAKLNKVSLFDYSQPVSLMKLKNVDYYGPLKGSPLGLFGQLLELKETPKYK